MKIITIPTLRCATCFLEFRTNIDADNKMLTMKHSYLSGCEFKGSTFQILLEEFTQDLSFQKISEDIKHL